jgi:DNA-binding transcriptional LysR family regulator
LLTYANKLVALVSEAERDPGCKDAKVSGELSLGVSTTIAQYVLARLLGAFLTEYPHIDFTLHSGITSEIVAVCCRWPSQGRPNMGYGVGGWDGQGHELL